MNLKCETILDFYTRKSRKIFCQIKVIPSKSHEFKSTCRSLTSDQWNTFDEELEKLLDCFELSEDGNKENFGKFIIRPNIEVKVQKSKLSLKYFCKFLSTDDWEKKILGNTEDVNDNAIILDCMLDFLHEDVNKPQEYEPSLDGKLSCSLKYEPYTPSKTKNCAYDKGKVKIPGRDLHNYNEDTYSPKPLFDTTDTQPLDKIIPKYKPAPINQNVKSKTKFVQKSKEEYIPETQKISTFDIPAYVPTPINCSPTKKTIKIFYEKPKITLENTRLRKRSKTVDTMPKDLSSGIFGNQRDILFATKSVEPLNENILKYKPTHTRETRISRDSDISDNKCTNEVINETDDESVPLQNYSLLRLKPKKTFSNEKDLGVKSKNKEPFVEDIQKNICIDKDININNKRFKGINELSEILPDSCKKRSKTLDSMPKELKTDNEKSKSKTTLEKDQKIEISDFKSLKHKENINESNKICIVTNGKENKSEGKSAKVLRSTSSSEGENSLELYKKTKKQTKAHFKESDNDFEVVTKINKRKCINKPVLSSPDSNGTDEASPTKDVQKSTNLEQPNTASLRRSDRSPSKPKRFIEEIIGVDSNRQKKLKKIKTSSKNKELFGSDDDEDDNDFESVVDNNNIFKKSPTATIFETPISKNLTKCSSSSSSKKKRKADKSNDCEQEKRNINKWLSKKKPSIQDSESTTSKVTKNSQRSKSPLTKSSNKSKSSKKSTDSKEACSESGSSTGINFDMPSKKELEEIRNKSKLKQKENEKLKAELDKMRATPPMEVENLSLQDMSLNDILDTFAKYRSELDEIYKKNCKRDYIKGHDGINHCFVIQLLQPNVQMKMLEKLTDVYSNSNNTMQATLYANALLPEWVIRVYMEKFSFTRQEAINQIRAQDDYRLHMEEQNDGSFIFN